MIDPQAIAEIIATYEKYDWILRRVLLTSALKEKLVLDTSRLFSNVQIKDADVDALWFSREPRPGGVAWEIRHLGALPYALLETLDQDANGFEDALTAAESRLRESLSKTKFA